MPKQGESGSARPLFTGEWWAVSIGGGGSAGLLIAGVANLLEDGVVELAGCALLAAIWIAAGVRRK